MITKKLKQKGEAIKTSPSLTVTEAQLHSYSQPDNSYISRELGNQQLAIP